jgi:hypothetical protein
MREALFRSRANKIMSCYVSQDFVYANGTFKSGDESFCRVNASVILVDAVGVM